MYALAVSKPDYRLPTTKSSQPRASPPYFLKVHETMTLLQFAY